MHAILRYRLKPTPIYSLVQLHVNTRKLEQLVRVIDIKIHVVKFVNNVDPDEVAYHEYPVSDLYYLPISP